MLGLRGAWPEKDISDCSPGLGQSLQVRDTLGDTLLLLQHTNTELREVYANANTNIVEYIQSTPYQLSHNSTMECHVSLEAVPENRTTTHAPITRDGDQDPVLTPSTQWNR